MRRTMMQGSRRNLVPLELELYFYLNTVNLSDKIIIIKITIYFTLYKHDLKISIVKIFISHMITSSGLFISRNFHQPD